MLMDIPCKINPKITKTIPSGFTVPSFFDFILINSGSKRKTNPVIWKIIPEIATSFIEMLDSSSHK